MNEKNKKTSMIREVKMFQAPDGKLFDNWNDACAYEQMLNNPEYQKLKNRIDVLEKEIERLKQPISINKDSIPFQQPIVRW